MEITLVRALAAAARAFADEIERGLPPEALPASPLPAPGSARSMLEVLRSVALINEHQSRGASDEEIRAIARRAGMDPRGMAGYYAASLLEKRDDGTRWVSQAGRDRLQALVRLMIMDASPPARPAHAAGSIPQRSPQEFDILYRGAPPVWDIGRPQPAFYHLAESGALRGRVLDIGCGTGEHALMAASLGLTASGIDAAPTAIGLAEKKAAERNLQVRFLVHDALELASLGERFETVLDCGLFHVFDDAQRSRYVDGLRTVVAPDGRYFLLCFSDRMPGTIGPRRISQDEIRTSFADGWRIESIEPATIDTNIMPSGALAWLAVIARVDDAIKAGGE
jgi:2-polyprenyl-3-methyl-5-hydroxy-6-metoxy-1,4-benzoquinol methylase